MHDKHDLLQEITLKIWYDTKQQISDKTEKDWQPQHTSPSKLALIVVRTKKVQRMMYEEHHFQNSISTPA